MQTYQYASSSENTKMMENTFLPMKLAIHLKHLLHISSAIPSKNAASANKT